MMVVDYELSKVVGKNLSEHGYARKKGVNFFDVSDLALLY